jgi:hypothetical protein
MEKIAQIASPASFGFCLLGGLIMVINGLDKENALVGGLGLVSIGIAFLVGPMLLRATLKK